MQGVQVQLLNELQYDALDDSLVRMHTEVAAMLSPQAQAHCWLWSPNEYSTCSRLITPPRVSQLMYYHDLVRAPLECDMPLDWRPPLEARPRGRRPSFPAFVL